LRRLIGFASILLLALGVVPAGAAATGDTGRYYAILGTGQHGSAGAIEALQFEADGTRPAHFDDQLSMYADLVYNSPGLADADITKYFKEAGFTVAPTDVTRTEKPRDGLTIVRDQYDIPHVYGDTAIDVWFGAGWAGAEDRLFVTDVLRHVGRGRMAEFLGPSRSNLAMDRSIARVAGYNEEELQLQFDLLSSKFPDGTGALTQLAIRSYVDGINAWIANLALHPELLPAEYPALQLVPLPFTVTDVVGVATLIQATFAAGGGGELSNAHLQQVLEGRFGHDKAMGIYNDLLDHEDPEAPVTTSLSFPYQDGAVDPASIAIPDAGSFDGFNPITTLSDSLREAGIPVPDTMSNWILINGQLTEDGHPIAVMGPQTGYYAPNLLLEEDLHGGGVDARGATFAGLGMFVLLGRGIDFAWSATSGESDMVDIRVEKLCNQDGTAPTKASTSYLIHGVCTPMYERTDRYVAKPSAGGPQDYGLPFDDADSVTPAPPQVITHQIERTAHGPVIGRATVDGAPVAISLQRATFFGEADSSPSFVLLNTNQVHDPASFFHAMSLETGSFNWSYVDADHAAFYHSGLYPKRAPGASNDLPTWGTGEWEWDGYLGADEHPHAVDPAEGFMASWNNKPARGWRASDANYGYNDVHRVQSLQERMTGLVANAGVRPVTVTDMIDVMEDAATVDLRGSQILPTALEVLGADNGDLQPYVDLLAAWQASGSHHRAPAADKPYDQQAAIALMDAWYQPDQSGKPHESPLINAVFDGYFKDIYADIPLHFDDTNRLKHIGSAYQDGWEAYLQKALRQRLGQMPGSAFDVLACGATLEDCRARLRSSLSVAVDALTSRFGGGPSKWTVDKSSESIRFVPVGLLSVPTIDWQNRPTFQQVVQVFSRR
jgi:acyl-homoserine lactone acylase PvdQ